MKKIIAIFSALTLILSTVLIFGGCKFGFTEETTNLPPETTSEEETQKVIDYSVNPLTGEAIEAFTEDNNRMVAIVVENSPAARPQWGITTPDILMEYEVEGGITRMLWLYANTERVPEKVGPVRSARHDIVELALGFDAIFVHWGGSTFAYETIREYSDILSRRDGLYHSCFFRDKERNVSSEHTGYTKGSSLRKSIDSVGISTVHSETYENPFNFSAYTRPLTAGVCNSISISFSSSYNYTFNYNSATNKYDTLINSAARTDENGTQCSYSNVIILYTDMVSLDTDKGHQDLLLENGGKGLYINGGNYEEITWTKTSVTDSLKLFSIDGTPLQLNTGNSYIGLVRSTREANTNIS